MIRRLALLGLVVVACNGPLAVMAPKDVTPRIAYIDGLGDLFTVRHDGSEARQLTSLGGPPSADRRSIHFWPTWTADSSRIAVVRADFEDGDVSRFGLYAVPTGGQPPTKLYEAEDSQPFFASWGPDGRSIAVLAIGEDGLGLHVARADGSAARRLDLGNPLYLAWSPDGRALAAHIGSRMSILPTDGSAVRTLPARTIPSRAPIYTADGQGVLFGGTSAAGRDAVLLWPLTGGDPTTVHEVDATPSFVLSPRGDRLAVSRASSMLNGFMVGLEVVDLPANTASLWYAELMFAFFWSPDGSKLAWIKIDPSERAFVWQVSDGLGPIQTITAFSPSPTFFSTLSFFDQYAQTTNIWAPDSKSLAFAGWIGLDTDGPSQIWTVEARAGATPKAVADGVMASWSRR